MNYPNELVTGAGATSSAGQADAPVPLASAVQPPLAKDAVTMAPSVDVLPPTPPLGATPLFDATPAPRPHLHRAAGTWRPAAPSPSGSSPASASSSSASCALAGPTAAILPAPALPLQAGLTSARTQDQDSAVAPPSHSDPQLAAALPMFKFPMSAQAGHGFPVAQGPSSFNLAGMGLQVSVIPAPQLRPPESSHGQHPAGMGAPFHPIGLPNALNAGAQVHHTGGGPPVAAPFLPGAAGHPRLLAPPSGQQSGLADGLQGTAGGGIPLVPSVGGVPIPTPPQVPGGIQLPKFTGSITQHVPPGQQGFSWPGNQQWQQPQLPHWHQQQPPQQQQQKHQRPLLLQQPWLQQQPQALPPVAAQPQGQFAAQKPWQPQSWPGGSPGGSPFPGLVTSSPASAPRSGLLTSPTAQIAPVRKEKVTRKQGNALQLPDDGHHWHKYGHKTLMDSQVSRAYYRCAQKNHGCLAKKTVDFPLKEGREVCVTYDGAHNHDAVTVAFSASSVVVRHRGTEGTNPEASEQDVGLDASCEGEPSPSRALQAPEPGAEASERIGRQLAPRQGPGCSASQDAGSAMLRIPSGPLPSGQHLVVPAGPVLTQKAEPGQLGWSPSKELAVQSQGTQQQGTQQQQEQQQQQQQKRQLTPGGGHGRGGPPKSLRPSLSLEPPTANGSWHSGTPPGYPRAQSSHALLGIGSLGRVPWPEGARAEATPGSGQLPAGAVGHFTPTVHTQQRDGVQAPSQPTPVNLFIRNPAVDEKANHPTGDALIASINSGGRLSPGLRDNRGSKGRLLKVDVGSGDRGSGAHEKPQDGFGNPVNKGLPASLDLTLRL